ncbi:MAG: DUF6493 family protein [Bacteroidota bacterium]
MKRFQLDKRQYTLEAWESVDQLDELPILTVFVQRANRILQSLHELADLPLFASPTHRPHWIDPQVLFSRAQAYEEAGIQLPVVELQIALCRVVLPTPKAVLAKIEGASFGERLALVHYLLNPQAIATPPFTHRSSWALAAFNKSGERKPDALFVDSSLSPAQWKGNYQWEIHQSRHGKLLRVENGLSREANRKSPWDKLRALVSSKGVSRAEFELYQLIQFPLSERWGRMNPAVGEKDALHFLSLIPRYPDVLYGQLLQQAFPYPDYSNERPLRSILALMPLQRTPFGEMGHLSLAMSLLCKHRDVRPMAAELLLWGMDYGLWDAGKLGQILGRLLGEEIAPLKRLTDALGGCFAELRQRHADNSYQLLLACLLGMPPKPQPNLNKLLAYFYEVQVTTQQGYDHCLDQQFLAWKSSRSLRKVIAKIEAFTA